MDKSCCTLQNKKVTYVIRAPLKTHQFEKIELLNH